MCLLFVLVGLVVSVGGLCRVLVPALLGVVDRWDAGPPQVFFDVVLFAGGWVGGVYGEPHDVVYGEGVGGAYGEGVVVGFEVFHVLEELFQELLEVVGWLSWQNFLVRRFSILDVSLRTISLMCWVM